MKKGDYFNQQDDQSALIRQRVEDFNSNKLYEFEIGVPETTGETTNPLEQGRNCPNCAGRLVTSEFEQPEEGRHLKCKNCGYYYYEEDLNVRDEVADNIYRRIPDRMFMKWEEFRKNQKTN